jgi:hypothetical protein
VPVAAFAGPILLNAPGAPAAVVNVHHVPALPVVVPEPLMARTCHAYATPAERPLTEALVAVPAFVHVLHAGEPDGTTQYV